MVGLRSRELPLGARLLLPLVPVALPEAPGGLSPLCHRGALGGSESLQASSCQLLLESCWNDTRAQGGPHLRGRITLLVSDSASQAGGAQTRPSVSGAPRADNSLPTHTLPASEKTGFISNETSM